MSDSNDFDAGSLAGDSDSGADRKRDPFTMHRNVSWRVGYLLAWVEQRAAGAHCSIWAPAAVELAKECGLREDDFRAVLDPERKGLHHEVLASLNEAYEAEKADEGDEGDET
jgi:hypothetical protein